MDSADDYRLSHMARGENYDAYVAETPFDAYMAEWERAHLATIVPALFPRRDARCLDFACGTGRITETLTPLCRDVLGVDISPAMLEVARRKVPGVDFRLHDLTRETPDLGKFDLVTAFRFFGNAQQSLREEALRAIARLVSHGGYLIVNSHRNPRSLASLFDRATGGNAGAMDLHMSKLTGLLTDHGFRIRRMQPIGAWMFRARLMNAYRADDPVAQARERRFSHPGLAPIAPDVVVVAQRD